MISWELNPVSTIPFVGKYWNYWYVLGNGRPSYSEEIVSTIRNNEKYVGEQDAEELSQCLLNPATRHIEQITVDNIEEADKLFDILMGPSVPPRREYMLIHGEEAQV